MLCELKKYPISKMFDDDFIWERKNEFYPEEEFGDMAAVCEKCNEELLEYYLNK
jgi:hypothetical protein